MDKRLKVSEEKKPVIREMKIKVNDYAFLAKGTHCFCSVSTENNE